MNDSTKPKSTASIEAPVVVRGPVGKWSIPERMKDLEPLLQQSIFCIEGTFIICGMCQIHNPKSAHVTSRRNYPFTFGRFLDHVRKSPGHASSLCVYQASGQMGGDAVPVHGHSYEETHVEEPPLPDLPQPDKKKMKLMPSIVSTTSEAAAASAVASPEAKVDPEGKPLAQAQVALSVLESSQLLPHTFYHEGNPQPEMIVLPSKPSTDMQPHDSTTAAATVTLVKNEDFDVDDDGKPHSEIIVAEDIHQLDSIITASISMVPLATQLSEVPRDNCLGCLEWDDLMNHDLQTGLALYKKYYRGKEESDYAAKEVTCNGIYSVFSLTCLLIGE
jgi:hypothetical protein